MKMTTTFKLLLTLLASFTLSTNAFNQSCGLAGNPQLSEITGIDFYDNESDEQFIVKVNLIFLHRDDGFGNFLPGSSEITTIENEMNLQWAYNNSSSCPGSNIEDLDPKIRVSVQNIIHINDTDAWDYEPHAGKNLCPGGIDQTNSTFPGLKQYVDQYQDPGVINIFFAENGKLLNRMEAALQNGTNLTTSDTLDVQNPDFQGCSRFASDFNSSQNVFIIIVNYYTDYQKKFFFKDFFFPNYNGTAQQLWNGQLWQMKALYNHELGHFLFDTGHQQHCWCTSNLMYSTDKCQNGPKSDPNYMEEQWLNTLHYNISSTNVRNYISCEDDVDYVYRSTDDVLIDMPMQIPGDFIVSTGTVVTVTNDMFLNETSKIIIETGGRLIIDGGHLKPYSDCSSNSWEGIRVNGGSNWSNGECDVIIQNGATIENTSGAAISMMPSGLPWNEAIQFGNGIAHIDGATFNNCRRMVEFISFTPQINSSHIRNSTQNGGIYGITNWNCHGIEITDTALNNVDENGVVTIDGSFTVDGLTANSNEVDVLLTMTAPGTPPTQVTNSNLNGDFYNVNMGGNPAGTHVLEDNHFNSLGFGIGAVGDIDYDILSNDFNNYVSLWADDNGTNTCLFHENDVVASSVGNWISDDMPAYLFYRNCYDTPGHDVYLSNATLGILSDVDGNACDNCFSHQGFVNNSHPYDIDGSWDEELTYVEPDDSVIDCQDVFNEDINIDLAPSSEGFMNCGSSWNGGGTSGNSTQYTMCNPARNVQSLQFSIDYFTEKIEAIQNSTSLSTFWKKRLISYYNRCLRKIKKRLYGLYLETKRYNAARSVYVRDNTLVGKTLIYGAYIQEGNYSNASNYLVSLDREESLIDFVDIQRMNLQRLQSLTQYQPTEEELLELKRIAEKHDQWSTYAKGLYYYFTGIMIYEEFSGPIRGNKVSTRENANDGIKKVSIFPNPFQNILNINNEIYSSFKVTSLEGHIVLSDDLVKGKNRFDTQNITKGVYFITLSNEIGDVFQDKFIKIN